MYVAVLEKVAESQQNNRVLHLTTLADDTNEKGKVPQRPKETAKLQRARETW